MNIRNNVLHTKRDMALVQYHFNNSCEQLAYINVKLGSIIYVEILSWEFGAQSVIYASLNSVCKRGCTFSKDT